MITARTLARLGPEAIEARYNNTATAGTKTAISRTGVFQCRSLRSLVIREPALPGGWLTLLERVAALLQGVEPGV